MRIAIYLMFLALAVSCKSREREKELDRLQTDLNDKEQRLLLREKTLEMREQEFEERVRISDSIRSRNIPAGTDTFPPVDSVQVDSTLTGNWAVKMTCTETSCPGSAIGDIKTEVWNLSYEGKHLLAKASDRGNLVRTYSGPYNSKGMELVEHRATEDLVYDTRMVVRLHVVNEKTIEGHREIIRDDECKIVYALQMNKLPQ